MNDDCPTRAEVESWAVCLLALPGEDAFVRLQRGDRVFWRLLSPTERRGKALHDAVSRALRRGGSS